MPSKDIIPPSKYPRIYNCLSLNCAMVYSYVIIKENLWGVVTYKRTLINFDLLNLEKFEIQKENNQMRI